MIAHSRSDPSHQLITSSLLSEDWDEASDQDIFNRNILPVANLVRCILLNRKGFIN